MNNSTQTRLLPLSLLVTLAASWVAYCLVWLLAFSSPEQSAWTRFSDQFEHTIFLWRVGFELRALGVMYSPAPSLILAAPFFPLAGLVAWAIIQATTQKSLRTPQSDERTFGGFLFAMLMPVAVIALEAHVIKGLPLARAALGSAALYESRQGLIYASIAIALMSAAIIATIVQARMAARPKTSGA